MIELLLVLGVIFVLAGIGRGGERHFRVRKTERGARWLAERRVFDRRE